MSIDPRHIRLYAYKDTLRCPGCGVMFVTVCYSGAQVDRTCPGCRLEMEVIGPPLIWVDGVWKFDNS